jgi:hypothetical protein
MIVSRQTIEHQALMQRRDTSWAMAIGACLECYEQPTTIHCIERLRVL